MTTGALESEGSMAVMLVYVRLGDQVRCCASTSAVNTNTGEADLTIAAAAAATVAEEPSEALRLRALQGMSSGVRGIETGVFCKKRPSDGDGDGTGAGASSAPLVAEALDAAAGVDERGSRQASQHADTATVGGGSLVTAATAAAVATWAPGHGARELLSAGGSAVWRRRCDGCCRRCMAGLRRGGEEAGEAPPMGEAPPVELRTLRGVRVAPAYVEEHERPPPPGPVELRRRVGCLGGGRIWSFASRALGDLGVRCS
mmetsp:Transcript_108500/g.312562  ORF Transcript_108500/g.312562 Transcript_108500/m.312562 type:complete len:258 (+) Transcript_108500:1482-2255(+)